MLFIAAALCLGFASCSSDDDEEPTPAKPGYANLISGHWANASNTETMSINYDGAGTIFYALDQNDWSILAEGTYTLNEDKLSATYKDVFVMGPSFNSGNTYQGFTDGKSKSVTYTIQSCDGKKLVMKDDSGKTLNYEKTADIK